MTSIRATLNSCAAVRSGSSASPCPRRASPTPDLKLFWRQRDIYSLWKESSGTLRIVFLGFGKLGEELLAELEHIRWCRYHYLNNWRFGQPESGKAKDPIRRPHAMLIPYDKLSEGEKEKDRENIRVLLSIQN